MGVIDDIVVTAQFVLPTDLVVTPVVNCVGGSLEPGVAQVVQKGQIVQFLVNKRRNA